MEKENKQKKKIILLVVPLLIIIFCLIGYILYGQESASNENSKYKTSTIQVNLDEKEERNKEQRMTKILGDNQNNIDILHPYIYLQNDSSNSVFLQFDIYEGEYLLYSSDLIEPDNMEKINIYKMLDKGSHTLDYYITSHNLENKDVMLSGIKQIKKIYIS